MNKRPELVDLSFVSVQFETEAAWLLSFDAKRKVEHWIPKSQCELDYVGRTVTIPLWLVETKGLEDYSQ